MRRYRFLQADVFTEVLFGGNPVAVFPEAEGLSDKEMQQIAREMNLSETAFVTPPTDPQADVRVRFFTPATELPFAGHPSIGAHVILAQIGRYHIDSPVIRVWQETGAGTLPVDLITDGGGITNRAIMTHAEARHGPIYDDREKLALALGLTIDDLHPDLPAQVYSTGLPGLLIPLASLNAIQHVTLNVALLNEIARALSVTEIEPFTMETYDPAHHIHARNFAPLVGVLEDPATGSIAGALGAYLLEKGVLDYDPEASTNHIVIEQGHMIGRPSLIEVDVDVRDGVTTEVRVGGQVVIALEGELTLD